MLPVLLFSTHGKMQFSHASLAQGPDKHISGYSEVTALAFQVNGFLSSDPQSLRYRTGVAWSEKCPWEKPTCAVLIKETHFLRDQ